MGKVKETEKESLKNGVDKADGRREMTQQSGKTSKHKAEASVQVTRIPFMAASGRDNRADDALRNADPGDDV